MKKEEILKKLKEINKKKYSILKLGLFGSFSKNSDTAILVKMEFKKGMYRNFCSLHKRLEEIFQKKVDLVDESMFEYKFKNPKVQKYKDEIKEEILRSVIYV
nr:nucleotidyltransferase domain-containing protein [uncultured Leptotrichia sp.]